MKEKICQLSCKKHIKIWKLYQLGLKSKEIAEAVGSNTGHVYNVIKEYNGSEEKQTAAALLNVVEGDERSVATKSN